MHIFVVLFTYTIFVINKSMQHFVWIISCAFGSQTKESNFTHEITIQAGKKGLEGVFFVELIASAEQDFGQGLVQVHSIDKSRSYIRQVFNNLRNNKPKYLILDPRTLSPNGLKGILQSMMTALLIEFKGITPIVFLTDASVIKYRIESIAWTARRGKCVMLMDPRRLGILLPHKRTYGPIFIPISAKTINVWRKSSKRSKSDSLKIGFKGTIYPERAKYLKELMDCSVSQDIIVKIEDKDHSDRMQDYWKFLSEQDVIFTTTVQTNIEGNYVDNIQINQLVFRISEAIALGKIVITTPVIGLDKFFKRDLDFIEIENKGELQMTVKKSVLSASKVLKQERVNLDTSFNDLMNNKCFWRILGVQKFGRCNRIICKCLN